MSDIKPAELILVCSLLLPGFVTAWNCTSPTLASLFEQLEKNVFPNKLVPPVKSFATPMKINISITLVGILGVDDKSQTLTTVLWQVLQWQIEGLSWDEKECGTKRVSVLRENLWIPDVHIAEFMDEVKSPETPYVYLDNTGYVYDDKPIRVVSSCKLVIYTFPFDIQNCSLTFGSYLHFATDIRMIQSETAEYILAESRDVLQTSGEWELAEINVVNSNLELTDGSYSEIKYFIVLKRRPTTYVVNLLLPSCFLVTVDLFSFLLPPQSVDRSSFKMTLILGYTVFLLIMNDLLPVTGETTPLINVFFSVSLALMVISLLETVFITNIQFRSGQYTAVPHWLSVLVLRYLAVVVCFPPKEKSNRITLSLNPSAKEAEMNVCATNISGGLHHSISDNTLPVKPPAEPALDELRKLSRDLAAIRAEMDKYFQGSKTSDEWLMIGIVVDRLLFGLYIVFIVVSFITIISIWIFNDQYGA